MQKNFILFTKMQKFLAIFITSESYINGDSSIFGNYKESNGFKNNINKTISIEI
jgi:hypothetical protein